MQLLAILRDLKGNNLLLLTLEFAMKMTTNQVAVVAAAVAVVVAAAVAITRWTMVMLTCQDRNLRLRWSMGLEWWIQMMVMVDLMLWLL